jgi:hypothetical protein
VALVFAEPFVVPREATTDQLTAWNQRLAQALDACEKRCLDVLSRHHV